MELSFVENHYHLGHKRRCNFPLIQDILQVLQTHINTISKTTNAVLQTLIFVDMCYLFKSFFKNSQSILHQKIQFMTITFACSGTRLISVINSRFQITYIYHLVLCTPLDVLHDLWSSRQYIFRDAVYLVWQKVSKSSKQQAVS